MKETKDYEPKKQKENERMFMLKRMNCERKKIKDQTISLFQDVFFTDLCFVWQTDLRFLTLRISKRLPL